MKLTVATCQFPTSGDIEVNLGHVLVLMREAKAGDAAIVHFPEACLSGYAGADISSTENLDWDLLRRSAERVMALAAELEVWVALGSTHRLSNGLKPHNSVFVINDRGELVDRYDKLFCAGNADCSDGDLAHYSPGNHLCVFEVNGVRCGVQICHDYRYPEIYRAYQLEDVQLMLHSFHAGNIAKESFEEMERVVGPEHHHLNSLTTIAGLTQIAGAQASASNNYMWISCSNSSAERSCWPAFVVRPDGVITGKLELHETGVLLSAIDTDVAYYDSTVAWRHRAMQGVLHSGELVKDPRSEERKEL